MEYDQAINALLFGFASHERKPLTDEQKSQLEVERLIAAGMLSPATPPDQGYVFTAQARTAIYIAQFAQRRADPNLENGVALFTDVNGERVLWCVDERNEVRPVPMSNLDGIDPRDFLAQAGWRYATAAEYNEARERALNSKDN